MKHYFYQLIFLLLIFAKIYSQESNVTKNYQGKDYTQLKHTWTAQWITHPYESTLDFGVFLFRKTFQINKLPNKLNIFVSADNRYRLYINEKMICFGPAMSDINHYNYETIDIAKYLRYGKNVITAEVINFGEFRRAAQQTFQTAFILQSEKNNLIDLNTGNTEWKVKKNYAYSYIPFTSDSFKIYYAAGPGEILFAEKYPWDWQKIEYDDSQWLKPRKATLEFAVGRGFLYGSTWFLVPRDIPFMEELLERFPKIVKKNFDVSDSFLNGKQGTIIPPYTKIEFLLDQTYHTTGYPILLFSKGKNSKIKITYAEALFKDIPTDKPISDGNLLKYDLKGNRNDITGKHILGYYDIIFPDGGKDRFFKPFSRRTYRYVQFNIETNEEELILDDYHGVYTSYPFEQKAKFIVDDSLLNKIWETAWRTFRNSSEEAFFDPYYEQLQYIGDARIESLISIFMSGDDRLMKKAIKQFDYSRITDGLTQSRYPSYIVQVIPTYSLLWIGMIHDYLFYRDNHEFIKELIPGIKGVLDWFERKIDNSGMLSNLEWWNFTDWTEDFMNGIPPGADDDHSANISLQYVLALQNSVEIFNYLGYKHESNYYSHLAKRIQKSVYKNCYDFNKNLFAETAEKNSFSQHTNILAILTDTYNLHKQKNAMKRILEDQYLIQTTIYFKFYLFLALKKVGMDDKYLSLLDPWKNMLSNGMTTFGETDKNPRSDCHAWSASPCFNFLYNIAGISSLGPKFTKVQIEPHLGSLKKIYTEFPHPKGAIKISLMKNKLNKISGEIEIPKNLFVILKVNGKAIKLKSGLNYIN